MAVVHLILDVDRGLNVPFLLVEKEIGLCARVKLRRIGDVVSQGLMHLSEKRIEACLPVVMTAMTSDVPTCIALCIAAILLDNNRRRQNIGAKRKA